MRDEHRCADRCSAIAPKRDSDRKIPPRELHDGAGQSKAFEFGVAQANFDFAIDDSNGLGFDTVGTCDGF